MTYYGFKFSFLFFSFFLLKLMHKDMIYICMSCFDFFFFFLELQINLIVLLWPQQTKPPSYTLATKRQH